MGMGHRPTVMGIGRFASGGVPSHWKPKIAHGRKGCGGHGAPDNGGGHWVVGIGWRPVPLRVLFLRPTTFRLSTHARCAVLYLLGSRCSSDRASRCPSGRRSQRAPSSPRSASDFALLACCDGNIACHVINAELFVARRDGKTTYCGGHTE